METRRRYKKNGTPRRGVDPRYKTCIGKRKFRNVLEAVREADRYMNLNHTLGRAYTAYPCPAHSNRNQMIFHCGHDRGLRGHAARDYTDACKRRGLLREEISSLKDILGILMPAVEKAGLNETYHLNSRRTLEGYEL